MIFSLATCKYQIILIYTNYFQCSSPFLSACSNPPHCSPIPSMHLFNFLSFALFVASLLLQDRISVAFSAACAFALHIYLCSYCSLFVSSLSSILHCSQVFLSFFIFWPLHILFFVVGFVVPSWPWRSLFFLPSITLFQLSSERSFALGCRNNER
jgi:hypothetical protein